jgi:hypothetical protein
VIRTLTFSHAPQHCIIAVSAPANTYKFFTKPGCSLATHSGLPTALYAPKSSDKTKPGLGPSYATSQRTCTKALPLALSARLRVCIIRLHHTAGIYPQKNLVFLSSSSGRVGQSTVDARPLFGTRALYHQASNLKVGRSSAGSPANNPRRLMYPPAQVQLPLRPRSIAACQWRRGRGRGGGRRAPRASRRKTHGAPAPGDRQGRRGLRRARGVERRLSSYVRRGE